MPAWEGHGLVGGVAELTVTRCLDYKKVASVFLAEVPIDDRVSLYAR
ncbi:MAG TPA: hypothetical protein VMF69_09380 [Gemmataceae bacterium]|nr:hypothetical protein [Gemmataceae bacterium]